MNTKPAFVDLSAQGAITLAALKVLQYPRQPSPAQEELLLNSTSRYERLMQAVDQNFALYVEALR